MAGAIFALFLSGFFALMMLLMVGAVSWGAYVVPKRRSEAWARAAEGVGLPLEPFDAKRHRGISLFYQRAPSYLQPMVGNRGGLPVRIGVRRVVTGSGKNRSVRHFTYAAVDFPRTLGMGLTIQGRGGFERFMADVVGQSDIETGDPRIDKPYAIHGVDADHVRRLLAVSYLAEALVATAGRTYRLHLTDVGLKFEAQKFCTSPTELNQVLGTAVDFAHRVGSARGEVGESSTQQLIEAALREVATRHTLTYDAARTLVQGRLEGMHVEADAELHGSSRHTRFTVRFDRALGIQLSLERQGTFVNLARHLMWMQDIQTGDPEFDERFIVKGHPEAAVLAALTPEVRARLSALQQQSATLVVHDNLIEARVGYPIHDAGQLEMGLFAMARVGAALAQVNQHPVGPFRG